MPSSSSFVSSTSAVSADSDGDSDQSVGDAGEDELRDVASTSTAASDDDEAESPSSPSSRFAASGSVAVKSSQELSSLTSAASPSFAYFVCLLYAFCVMGFDMGLLGPSLLEMAAQVGATISNMSFVLAARSVGLLVGTLIAGYFIDRRPTRGHVILLSGVVSISAVTAVFPFIGNLYLLVLAGCVHGVTMGLVDNTSQILLIRHYGSSVAPYMQALHCAFGAGALFSPLVLSPFLSNTEAPTETLSDGTVVVYDVTFHWAWIIMAVSGLPCALWLAYYTRTHDLAPQPQQQADSEAAVGETEDGTVLQQHGTGSGSGWHEAGHTSSALTAEEDKAAHQFQLRVVLNIGVFLSLYVGCETGYGSYIYSYAVTQLGVSADSGAYLNSGYWGSFTVGRFLGIFVSLYASPQQMVVADLLGCIAAVVVIMAAQSSFAALWLGTALYGLSVGSVYASAINYTERLVGVSGRLLSYLTFFAALGDALVPLAIGAVFDTEFGGRGMMWVVVAVAATATSTFAFLWYWVDRSQAAGAAAGPAAAARDTSLTRGKQQRQQQHDEGHSSSSGSGTVELQVERMEAQPAVRSGGSGGEVAGWREDGHLDGGSSGHALQQRHSRNSGSGSGSGSAHGSGRGASGRTRTKMGYAQLPSQLHSATATAGTDHHSNEESSEEEEQEEEGQGAVAVT